MSFKDRLTQAAAITKWKADQQMRLMRVQNNIRDVDGQIKNQKTALAESVLSLYGQNQLSDEPLRSISAAIVQLQGQVQQLNDQAHQIQAEQPPSDNEPAPVPAPAPAAPPTFAAPQPAAPSPFSLPQAPAPAQPQPPAPTVMSRVCPVCGQVLKGKFCPEDGVEGVLTAQPAA